MISHDKNLMTLAKLREVPVTDPPRGPGKIWKGVPHGTLVDAVMDAGRDGFGTAYDRADVRVWTTEDGGDLACSIPVKGGTEFDRRGLVPHLGLIASNRQTEVLTAFCGAVGPAGLLFVDGKLSRNKDAKWMYTTHFDLKYACDAIWTWWQRHLKSVLADFDRLAEAECSPGRVNNLLMTVGRRGILPWSRVGVADAVFRRAGGATVLDLYAAVSQALQMSNGVNQLKNGWRLNSLLCHSSMKKKEAV